MYTTLIQFRGKVSIVDIIFTAFLQASKVEKISTHIMI